MSYLNTKIHIKDAPIWIWSPTSGCTYPGCGQRYDNISGAIDHQTKNRHLEISKGEWPPKSQAKIVKETTITPQKIYHGTIKHESKCIDHTFWVYVPSMKILNKWDTHLPVNTYCNNHIQRDKNTFTCLGHTNSADFIAAQKEWKQNKWTEEWSGIEQKPIVDKKTALDDLCEYESEDEEKTQLEQLVTPSIDYSNRGTIYLIQPAELVGTNRYKIGCSAKNDLKRCNNGYKIGTRFITIMECLEPFAVEREIKKIFNSKFKLIAGKEYFEGNEEEIKVEFYSIVTNFTNTN